MLRPGERKRAGHRPARFLLPGIRMKPHYHLLERAGNGGFATSANRSIRRAACGALIVLIVAVPASAATSLSLSPNRGSSTTSFSARVSFSTKGKCPSATLTWDGAFLASVTFPGQVGTCTATRSGLRPLTGHRSVGAHMVRASMAAKPNPTSVSATFTITSAPKPTPTPTPTPTKAVAPRPTPTPSASPSPSASAQPSPSSTSLTIVPSVVPSASSPATTSPSASPTLEAAPVVHHRGSDGFWIVFAILATLVLGPGVWFVLGRDRSTDSKHEEQH